MVVPNTIVQAILRIQCISTLKYSEVGQPVPIQYSKGLNRGQARISWLSIKIAGAKECIAFGHFDYQA